MRYLLALFLLLVPGLAMAHDDVITGFIGLVVILLILVFGILLYFVPAMIAYYRKTTNFTAVLLINIFLGWTFIGWVVCLIIAFTGKRRFQA